MPDGITSFIVNQVIAPGSRFLSRVMGVLGSRWKPAMLLPETLLIIMIIVGAICLSGRIPYGTGQSALASMTNGAPVIDPQKLRQFQSRVKANPDAMMKMSKQDVTHVFSYVDLQRHEGDTTILHFRGKECILDVYLEGRAQGPTHYEFHPRRLASVHGAPKIKEIKARDCVEDILKSRRL